MTATQVSLEELRESQERLQHIMDNIPHGIFWKDRHSIYLGCNVNFARSAGLRSAAEIVGKTDFDLPWTDEEAVWYREVDERVMRDNAPEYHIIETQWQASGERALFNTNKVPLHDSGGNVVGILGTAEDITERKRIQEELQRAHDELEQRVQERTDELARANVQLEQEIAERRQVEAVEREQRALAEALRETAALLNSTLDLDEVLDRILSEIDRVVPASSASILLVEGDHVVAARSHDESGRPTIGSSLVGRPIDELPTLHEMAQTREPLVIAYTRGSALWQDRTGDPSVRAYLGAPILVEDGVIGFINLNARSAGSFGPAHAERLGIFANQAAIAIQNARLYKRAEELAALKERQRLARDLHDEVSQTLWTMKLISDVLPAVWAADRAEGERAVQDLGRLATGALAEMRTLILELRPAALVEGNLGDLLTQLAAASMSRKRIAIETTTRGTAPIPDDVRVALYRIAQEALNNVSRHSRAARAFVDLRQDARGTVLRVADDGRGIDRPAHGDSHGLRIMRERADAIGANLRITSTPGRGTTVRASWRRPASSEGQL